MNKKIVLGIIILLLVSLLVFIGYWKKGKEEKKPEVIEVPEETKGAPIPISEEPKTEIPLPPTTTTTTPTSTKTYQLLFDQSFLYLDLDYPLLYVYDTKDGVIKYLNLEDETYREIYKISNLKNALFSYDKTKIVLEVDTGFSLLDLKTDSLYRLPPLAKNFVFSPKGLIVYLNDKKKISYLAYFQEGKTIKIRDLGILNPEFISFKNNLLIYEEGSPIFLLDLSRPETLKVFLEPQENYSLLVNKNEDLVFLSFKENGWQSKIIDLGKKTKFSFSWGTIKDKCSFTDVLVCALPLDQQNFSLEDWYLLGENYDEKLIIYNPQNNKLEEIKLEAKFDAVKPKLTPLGIIFWNRLDAKFYLIKLENFSL